MRDVPAAVTCFFCISVCCFQWFIILCFHLIYPYMGTINCCFLVVVVVGVVFSCKWNNGSLYPSLVCFCFTSVRKCIALESYRPCTFELDTEMKKERCRVYLWHVDFYQWFVIQFDADTLKSVCWDLICARRIYSICEKLFFISECTDRFLFKLPLLKFKESSGKYV